MSDERDVVAALELPDAATVVRHEVKPGDVIVIECDDHITMEHARRIQDYAEKVWPQNRVAVMGKGLHVKVMEAVDERP